MAKTTTTVESLEGESKSDYLKFRVFLALGTNRSLDKAYKAYYETNHEVSALWQNLADKYHWVDRAAEHDKSALPIRSK